jgi:hypothetical protein
MDLMHPPLPLGAWRPFGAFLRQRRMPQKLLHHLAHLQPRRRGHSLVLIARPGIAKTDLSDQMVRIKAAKAPSLLMILAAQLHLKPMTKTTHRVVQQLCLSAGLAIARRPREHSETAELAGDLDDPRVEELATAGRSVAGDRYFAPLAASYHLERDHFNCDHARGFFAEGDSRFGPLR